MAVKRKPSAPDLSVEQFADAMAKIQHAQGGGLNSKYERIHAAMACDVLAAPSIDDAVTRLKGGISAAASSRKEWEKFPELGFARERAALMLEREARLKSALRCLES